MGRKRKQSSGPGKRRSPRDHSKKASGKKRPRNDSSSDSNAHSERGRKTPRVSRRHARQKSRVRRLTDKRTLVIIEFLAETTNRPQLHGAVGTEQWLNVLIERLDPRGLYQLNHEDVLGWIENTPEITSFRARLEVESNSAEVPSKGPKKKNKAGPSNTPREDNPNREPEPGPSTSSESMAAIKMEIDEMAEEYRVHHENPSTRTSVPATRSTNPSRAADADGAIPSTSAEARAAHLFFQSLTDEIVMGLANMKTEPEEEEEGEEGASADGATEEAEAGPSQSPEPRPNASEKPYDPEVRIREHCILLLEAVHELARQVAEGELEPTMNVNLVQAGAYIVDNLANVQPFQNYSDYDGGNGDGSGGGRVGGKTGGRIGRRKSI